MDDVLMFFNRNPDMLPLYQAIEDVISAEFEDVRIKVQKTQISLYNKHLFACVSLPQRKVKSWPEKCLVLTLGLNRKLEHPRITYAVEPYPGRWTHHILIQSETEIDVELIEWIREAYDFAIAK